ncbi:imidazole glycerol phosphate synthase subunit HisH [Gemmata sp. JC673]|uniref:Imidazole glycerol phosphate synthase subunit HisH n=1 Tax=Gemmata algarum TaxID=2975278 RepID=A0ABU5ETZ4_9BACT|nr:imidazole glycerol phosphate synthase subunit HisH [Gemmata algarum]MDY3557925.1 imidazole glycerol phosphate synthase subunit HisH [Gemmata algarum]
MTTLIVDYGMANLRSVQKAFEQVGHNATISGDPKHLATASRVVLPGVGAFRDAIARLRETGLDDAVRRHIDAGRPFLGICLGMQLLFSRSHEDGVHVGLNVFQGDVVKFPPSPALKVPHMGWNTLKLTKPDCPLLRGLSGDPAVYFVHSYFATPAASEIVAATADYPAPFCSVVWKGNVYATQFHPEKSQRIGVQMLRNFSSL